MVGHTLNPPRTGSPRFPHTYGYSHDSLSCQANILDPGDTGC